MAISKDNTVIGEGLGVGDLAYKEVLRPAGSVAGFLARAGIHVSENVEKGTSGAATTTLTAAEFGQGMLDAVPVAFIFALLSVWDHEHTMRILRSEFECEIGAQLGKSPETVTVKDMELVAKHNPVIADAINRSRKQRNLSIAITTLGTFASVTAALLCTPAILGLIGAVGATGFMATAAVVLLHGAAGFLAFMGIEKVADHYGKEALHLNEPPLRAAELSPDLQSELSVANQIRLLARAQARRKPVSQAQVLTVFLSANPGLNQQVSAQYGAPFAALPDTIKTKVANDLGIAQLTDDINNHQVRAQELAFAVTGQSSGVPRTITPQQTKLEAAQDRLAQAEAKIQALTHKVEEKTQAALHTAGAKMSQVLHPEKEKMAFANASVSGVVPENQNIARVTAEGRGAAASASIAPSWTERTAQPTPAPGMAAAIA